MIPEADAPLRRDLPPRGRWARWESSPRADRVFRMILGMVSLLSAAVMVWERGTWYELHATGPGSEMAFDALVAVIAVYGAYTLIRNLAAILRGEAP